jgi:hypothetical protein
MPHAGSEPGNAPARPSAAERRRDHFLWLLVAWALAVLLFAALRTPYDDEWYSIALALERDAGRFWGALVSDVHPPWVALLDRALLAGGGPRWLINLPRVLASAGAVWITASLVRRQFGLARGYVLLAASHPVVFMYAGAARWYPFLFLAHALRALSIWGFPPGRPGSGPLFVAGAGLGLAAGYVEPPFVLLDLVWLHLRNAGQPRARRNLGLIALASVAVLMLLRLASPVAAAHAPFAYGQLDPILSQAVSWLGLGVAGEAALPFPFPMLGLAVAAAAALGFVEVGRRKPNRPYAIFLASNAVAWLCLTPFGVWHPRYSLEVWLGLTLMVVVPLAGGIRWRWLAWLASAHLLVALVLTLLGRGFYKGDLNRLDGASCGAVRDATAADLIVAPYPRLAELVASACAPAAPITALAPIRIVPAADQQLLPLRQHLRVAARVFLLTMHTTSSLSETQARVRRLLAGLCLRAGAASFGEAPHHALRRLWRADAQPYRFEREVWQCPASRASPARSVTR